MENIIENKKTELEKELLSAKRKLRNLPLDCTDNDWTRHVRNVEKLELELKVKK